MNVWFTARGAGLSALILLSAATCLGAVVSRHTGSTTAGRRYVVQYLHRALAGLGILVLAVHITTILADSYSHVGLTGALIPFTSGYRPTPVALGSLAAYTFLGVAVLGLARGRMARSERGTRLWRRLHAGAYVGWAMAIAHGFTSGTDSSVGWVRGVYLACLLAVMGALTARLAAHLRPEPPAQPAPGRIVDRFEGRPVPSRATPAPLVRAETVS